MRIVKEGQESINKLLGKQSIKNTQYRQMKYLLRTACKEGELLHNVITGKLVLLDNEEAEAINLLPSYPNNVMKELIESYCLVPNDFDEKEFVKQIRLVLQRIFIADGINGYTILTTTNCNARCFYCYQSGYTHINMNSEVAEKLADYMIAHKGKNPIKLHWFGGEPLVGMNRIDQICKRLQDEGIRYSSNMISNGYLFSEDVVKKAKANWKLRSVQITLDGTEKIYNQTKAYVSAKDNPYSRVLGNIRLLLESDIRVLVRMNLDMHNAEDLANLIEELRVKFSRYEKIDVYAHVLFENEGQTPIERTDETRRQLFMRMIELNYQLEQLGLSNRLLALPSLKVHNCMADRKGTVVVYPDGRLYKCEHIVFEDFIGDLDFGIIVKDKIHKYQTITELEECNTCPLYPSCVLLKECNGLEDYNRYTCEFRRESFKRAMIRHFEKANSKQGREIDDKNLEIDDICT